MMDTILAILASSIRLAIPYTLAGLGGTYSERSGVVNIGLEGMMLTGAFTAVAVTNATGSPWVGLVAAILATSGGMRTRQKMSAAIHVVRSKGSREPPAGWPASVKAGSRWWTRPISWRHPASGAKS